MGGVGGKQSVTTSHIKGVNKTFDNSDSLETVPGCLEHFAKTLKDRDAVVFRSTLEPRLAVSWKDMYERSRTVAKSLVRLGVQPGDHVIVISRSCPETLYATYGTMMAGASVINLVFTYVDGSDFIAVMDKIESCAAIILDPGSNESNWRILKSVLDEFDDSGSVSSSKIPFLRKLIFIRLPKNERVKTVADLLVEDHVATDLPPINPDDVAVMFQTSGSTGVPKLVCHTHSRLVAFRNVLNFEAFAPEDIFYNDRPFSWIGGFWFGLLIGQTRVTLSGFSPPPENKASFIIDVIKSERCTIAGLFPTLIDEVLQRQDELPVDWSLKAIWTGGQPITKAVAAGVGKICKYICLTYGGTEFLAVSSMVVDKQEDIVDYASGVLIPGAEVKIVGDDGDILPINTAGEIYFRSPYLFKGYLNDTERTASVMTSDGWYKTDDYGRINEDGYLFVDGRVSDKIISSGMTVVPAVLEVVMKSCPGVDSAVMVPVPDALMYQTVCACVTVKPGYDVTVDRIRDYMESMHNDKNNVFTVLPKYYVILDKFPEETNGKISKKSLRRMAKERFAS